MKRKKNLKLVQYGGFRYYKDKQHSKENWKNTFFHLIMLFLRSRREFDGVWRFSYQSIGLKCGEPRTKGKLSPQSSSKTGGEFSSPCLPSVSNHSLTESTSVWTELAGRSQHCTKLSAFEIPQCCKKCNVWRGVWGGFQRTWHEMWTSDAK